MIQWDFIDKIIYINLEKRVDRRKHIEAELKRVGVPEDKIIRFAAIEDTNGALGCAKSHLSALVMAQINQWKNVLILEDDMMFNTDPDISERTNTFFRNLQNINWDVAFLSASYFIIKERMDYTYKVEFAYLANSYIVQRHYYQKLLHNYGQSVYLLENGEKRNKAGIDTNWMKLMSKDNWYGIYPCIGYQHTSMSDIEKVEVDRKRHFYRPISEIKRFGSY